MPSGQDHTTVEVNESSGGEDGARHSDTLVVNGGLLDKHLLEEWLVKQAVELSRLEASEQNAKVILFLLQLHH